MFRRGGQFRTEDCRGPKREMAWDVYFEDWWLAALGFGADGAAPSMERGSLDKCGADGRLGRHLALQKIGAKGNFARGRRRSPMEFGNEKESFADSSSVPMDNLGNRRCSFGSTPADFSDSLR